MNPTFMNPLVIAYLGDSIFEVLVRRHLIEKGIVKPHLLQKESIKFVSAKSQASFIKYALSQELLSEEEIGMYKRGRNVKANHLPKNTDIQTYQMSSGFEALIGTLELLQKQERITEIFELYKVFVNGE